MNEELEQIKKKLKEKRMELDEKVAEWRKYLVTEPLEPGEVLEPIPGKQLKKAHEEKEKVYKENLKLRAEFNEVSKMQRG